MKKWIILLIYGFIFTIDIHAQNTSSVEAPLTKLDVYINDKLHHITDGDTIHFDNHRIVIKTSDYLNFDVGVLKFDYPEAFRFRIRTGSGL